MLYNKYVKMHIKSSMQYRANMLMLGFSSCLISIGELLAILVMFKTFKTVGSWGFYETALMFGLIATIYSFTLSLFEVKILSNILSSGIALNTSCVGF